MNVSSIGSTAAAQASFARTVPAKAGHRRSVSSVQSAPVVTRPVAAMGVQHEHSARAATDGGAGRREVVFVDRVGDDHSEPRRVGWISSPPVGAAVT
jgi:hypothetical protein